MVINGDTLYALDLRTLLSRWVGAPSIVTGITGVSTGCVIGIGNTPLWPPPVALGQSRDYTRLYAGKLVTPTLAGTLPVSLLGRLSNSALRVKAVQDDGGTLRSDSGRDLDEVGGGGAQSGPNALLLVVLHEEEHEPAAPGAE